MKLTSSEVESITERAQMSLFTSRPFHHLLTTAGLRAGLFMTPCSNDDCDIARIRVGWRRYGTDDEEDEDDCRRPAVPSMLCSAVCRTLMSVSGA